MTTLLIIGAIIALLAQRNKQNGNGNVPQQDNEDPSLPVINDFELEQFQDIIDSGAVDGQGGGVSDIVKAGLNDGKPKVDFFDPINK
jgi:hypothetical protein